MPSARLSISGPCQTEGPSIGVSATGMSAPVMRIVLGRISSSIAPGFARRPDALSHPRDASGLDLLSVCAPPAQGIGIDAIPCARKSLRFDLVKINQYD